MGKKSQPWGSKLTDEQMASAGLDFAGRKRDTFDFGRKKMHESEVVISKHAMERMVQRNVSLCEAISYRTAVEKDDTIVTVLTKEMKRANEKGDETRRRKEEKKKKKKEIKNLLDGKDNEVCSDGKGKCCSDDDSSLEKRDGEGKVKGEGPELGEDKYEGETDEDEREEANPPLG